LKLVVQKHQQRGLEAVLVSDTGAELIWSLSAMSRNLVRGHDLIFLEVNAYWATLSANRRKQIFALYADIHEHIDEVLDVQNLQKVLIEKITRLMELHPAVELEKFLPTCQITYPLSVKDNGMVQFQPNKTYDVAKYSRILVLATAIRVLTPIWSVYVSIMDKYAPKNYKELMALRLLTQSWIKDYQGFSELQAYVGANIREDESSLSSVIGGVGSEMIPEWLLALICVRRLATKGLSGDGENNNLVSNIHSIVTHTLKGKDKTFSGYFHNKDVRGDSDENLSLLEEYKIKQAITEGDKATFSAYLTDPVAVTHKIDDGIDPKVINAAWRNNKKALDCSVSPGQMRLLQWVCGPVLPPNSIIILNKPNKLKLLSTAQTVLHHWGYPQVAAFMVARRVDDGMQKVQVAENRARFPKELATRIAGLYPHVPQHFKSQRHPVIEAIVRTVEDLSSADWFIEAPSNLVEEVDEYIVDGQYVTPGDIQRILAELVVYIAERNQ
jgi:hypothetical protein